MPHHHMHYGHTSQRPSPLEISELADFDASLGDLTEDDRRGRRIFYLRDAIAQVEMGKTLLKGFGCFMIPMLVIPIFWPFIAFFWFMRKSATRTMDTQFRNALAYWNLREEDVRPAVDGSVFTGPVATGSRPAAPAAPPVIEAEVVSETTEREQEEPVRKRYRREP